MMIKTSKLLLKHQLCLERSRDQKLKCLICHSFLSFLAKRCLEMTFLRVEFCYEIKPHKVWLFLPQALFLLLIKLSSIARNKWQWWQQQKTKEIRHKNKNETWQNGKKIGRNSKFKISIVFAIIETAFAWGLMEW